MYFLHDIKSFCTLVCYRLFSNIKSLKADKLNPIYAIRLLQQSYLFSP